MSSLYLLPDLAVSHEGDTVTVTGMEARHAVTVGRLRAGERIAVGNGKGLVVTGEVLESRPDRFSVRVTEVTEAPRPAPALWLVQALAKGGRDEMAIQAATELGIDVVIPWAAQRSVVRWDGAKSAKGVQRWGAIVREATKQSIRPWLPEVRPLASTSDVAALGASMRVLVLDPTSTQPLKDVEPDERDIVLVVGPEGGIAPAELERFEAAGAGAVRLGDTVLRTSTAGPAALAILNARLGRW